MAIRQRLARWLIRLEHWLEAPLPTIAGGRSDGDIPMPSSDLLQPLLLPGYMQRSFKDEKQQTAFLQESAKSAYMFGFDSPFAKDVPFMPPSEDPLKEWDIGTREYVLSQCHAAYMRHPIANAAVEYTADFVIGKGFNLTCKNEDIEKFLKDFIASPDNVLRKYERQAVIGLQVDGEILLRYFKGKSEDGTPGQIAVLPLRPWELQWIETELGNFRRPVNYRFQRYQTKGDDPSGFTETKYEDVAPDEILHVAINNQAYELRGRPDLYRILPWLRADTEFQQNRARQNFWRGALLWLVSVGGGANASQVASVVNRWSKPPTPGSVAVESENVTVTAATNPSHGSDAQEDGRQIKLRSIIGLRMAEYMFADGQNANLASATAQQLPAITRFEAYQTVMIEQVWYPLFKKALQSAIDAGILPEECEECDSAGNPVYEKNDTELPAQPVDATKPNPVLSNPEMLMPKEQKAKMCSTLEAFDVTYAPVQSDDIYKLMQALSIAETQEWVSKQGAQERAGFDPAIENERIEQEQKNNLKKMAQGTKPVPPDMMPQPDPNMPPGKPGM